MRSIFRDYGIKLLYYPISWYLMKRGTILLITLILLVLLLATACEDIGKECDEHGVCTGISDEDQDTLEPELVADIRPDSQETILESP